MSVGLLIQHVTDLLVASLEMSRTEARHGTMLKALAHDWWQRRLSPECKEVRFKLLTL